MLLLLVLGFLPCIVRRLKKPIYGLVPSRKACYDALLEVCREEGFGTDVSDEGMIRLCEERALVGILSSHVDDSIGAGQSSSDA